MKKFDTVIGNAARDIEPGEHVHSHNIELIDFDRDPGFCEDVRPVDYVPEDRARHLHGHRAARRTGGDAQLHRHPVAR